LFILWVILVPTYAGCFLYWVYVAFWHSNTSTVGLCAPDKAAIVAGVSALIVDIIRLFVYTLITFFQGEVTFFGDDSNHAGSQLTGTMVFDVVILVSLFLPCTLRSRPTSIGAINKPPISSGVEPKMAAMSSRASLPALLMGKYIRVPPDDGSMSPSDDELLE
jgi:hypothetical protein